MTDALEFKPSEPLTLGVELELQLVDRRDGDLTRAATDLLPLVQKRHPGLDVKLEITKRSKNAFRRVVERVTAEGFFGELGCEWQSCTLAAPSPNQEGSAAVCEQFFELHPCFGEGLLVKSGKIVGRCHAVACLTESSAGFTRSSPEMSFGSSVSRRAARVRDS